MFNGTTLKHPPPLSKTKCKFQYLDLDINAINSLFNKNHQQSAFIFIKRIVNRMDIKISMIVSSNYFIHNCILD